MKQIAKDLLSIKAVELSPSKPFTWASGIKSPIYCDNRLTISYPEIRKHIAEGISEQIKENYPEVQVIAGTATAGIPHAAWVSELLNLPMIYVRSKPKDHGQGKQIEGILHQNDKVVVIDDLMSTGGSVLKVVDVVQQSGADVLGVAGIFSYQLSQLASNFKKADILYTTITNYSELIDVALEQNYIDNNQREILAQWRQDPEHWQK